MKVYSHIKKEEGKIPVFSPEHLEGHSTFSYWSTDESDSLLSFLDARPATYEEIDDRAEAEGLTAWVNLH